MGTKRTTLPDAKTHWMVILHFPLAVPVAFNSISSALFVLLKLCHVSSLDFLQNNLAGVLNSLDNA